MAGPFSPFTGYPCTDTWGIYVNIPATDLHSGCSWAELPSLYICCTLCQTSLILSSHIWFDFSPKRRESYSVTANEHSKHQMSRFKMSRLPPVKKKNIRPFFYTSSHWLVVTHWPETNQPPASSSKKKNRDFLPSCLRAKSLVTLTVAFTQNMRNKRGAELLRKLQKLG